MLKSDFSKNAKYSGFIQSAFDFVENSQLLREDLWERFVQQFREDADYEGGWRGEYWGKMMRGACLVYQYTKNEKLYAVLCKTVSDMIESADENGRISSYFANHEFEAWDMWCRKYVLLGMEYFLEICKDEKFAADIIKSMCGQLDYIIERIGRGEGKKEITAATRHWRGLNSSSILEPVVKLYNLTGNEKYFEFAKYIVDIGCIDVSNIFELAYENKFYPYQYPVTKAYEMTSCFEGLIEFYKITGDEKYKTAIVNFADKVLESDFTVIGCCGCTHELFDHSTVRQANTTNEEIMQETCVTVTLMKFFYRVHLMTGDSKYADAFEISLYNAYLGSFNTEGVIEPMIKREHPDWTAEPLPFDSYSPLTAGTRGNGIGGLKCMSDNHYYGCCACIGSAGIGLVPQIQLLKSKNGVVLNLYINGKVEIDGVTLNIETEYPKCGKVKITVESVATEKFEIALRNPAWSKNTKVNGKPAETTDGYIKIDRNWEKGDAIELEFDMSAEVIYPIAYGSDILMSNVVWGYNYIVPKFDEEDPLAKKHIAIRRGAVMLAMENRLGYSVDDPIDVKIENGFVDVKLTDREIPYDSIVKAEIPLTDGGFITVTDYASAGKLWTEESKMAVWLMTK